MTALDLQTATVAELAASALAGDEAADAALTIRAASGCIDSQRLVLDHVLVDPLSFEALVSAEMLARMVAARGTARDRHRLAGMLWLMAQGLERVDNHEGATLRATDALNIFRDLADAGDGPALEGLTEMGSLYPDIAAAIESARSQPVSEAPVILNIPMAFATSGAVQRDGLLSRLGWALRRRWWAIQDLWWRVRWGF